MLVVAVLFALVAALAGVVSLGYVSLDTAPLVDIAGEAAVEAGLVVMTGLFALLAGAMAVLWKGCKKKVKKAKKAKKVKPAKKAKKVKPAKKAKKVKNAERRKKVAVSKAEATQTKVRF